MSLGIVLDVAIGLAFTYLLMAIIVSGLVEVLAGWRKWRGKSLRDGIAGLLDAGDHPLLDQLFKDVFTHGLVADLSSRGLPSYVPSRNFAMALLDVLKPDGSTGTAFSRIQFGIQKLPSGTVKQALSTFVEHAAGDAEALQKRIESWFDDSMDRLTGEYKRHTQAWMIGLALVAAMVLNVDSISLARTLWTDPAVRSAMVGAAQQYVDRNGQQTAADAKQRLQDASCALEKLPLPIGWTLQTPKKMDPPPACDAVALQITDFKDAMQAVKERFSSNAWIWMIVGWLLTALAVSFGAPFWFDALKNLLNVRNAGPKPPRSEASGGTS
jgi:hypothetical protein